MKVLLVSIILAHLQQAFSQIWSIININNNQWSEILTRDICIIGGGASGIHAAVQLKSAGKSVIAVERNDFLGGGTHTYIDPATQVTVDIGVVVFQPIPDVFDFFKKLAVPIMNMSNVVVNKPGQPPNPGVPAAMFQTVRKDADFRDGSEVIRNLPIGEAEAFSRFAEILEKYAYLLKGYALPDPVPEDLYLPFGAFIDKYNLGAALPTIYQISQGMGDLLHVSTIYAIKYFNLGDLQALTQGYFTHPQGNNSELYIKSGEFLGKENVLLESTVVSANRKNTTNTGRPELLVSTRNEGLKLLDCKQILLTIPPTLDNLRGWDLTTEEEQVFSKYTTSNGYWTGLVKGIGLNETETIFNSASNTPWNIPVLPGLYQLSPVGVIPGVWWIKFAANNPTLSDAQVKSYIERQIATLQRAKNTTIVKPEWLIFESHTPFHLQVAPEAIKHGFFKDLAALQGGSQGTMFYSGAAFHTQYSSLLFRFNNEVVIPKILGEGM